MNTRTLQEQLNDWQHGCTGSESTLAGWELVALFDHDYEQHLLIQEWDFTADSPAWIYSLWFLGVRGLPELVRRWNDGGKRWHDGNIPWVEAAELVASRRSSPARPN